MPERRFRQPYRTSQKMKWMAAMTRDKLIREMKMRTASWQAMLALYVTLVAMMMGSAAMIL